MNIKVKDITTKEAALPVIELVSDEYYKAEVAKQTGSEEEKVAKVNKDLFEEAERIKDENITISEINEKIANATKEEMIDNVKKALYSRFNYLQILSVPGNDGKQVFFVVIAGIGGDGDAADLLSKQAKIISENTIDGTDLKIGEFNIVVLDSNPNGTFTPRPIAIKD